ncbi:hypothetical protein BaRGS_00020228, partial [Batillaria attramentaria]
IVGSAWPSGACHYDQMDTCPHVQYLNLQLQQVIPLPDPDNLKTVCDNIGEGFRCLLGPSVLGNCPAAIKAAYEAMQKASEIPCFRNKQAFLFQLFEEVPTLYVDENADCQRMRGQREAPDGSHDDKLLQQNRLGQYSYLRPAEYAVLFALLFNS